MKIVETQVTQVTELTRRVTFELPESRAKVLKGALESAFIWDEHGVVDEMDALHEALGGWGAS